MSKRRRCSQSCRRGRIIRQFVFARAPHLLDLPAPGVGKDQGPEIVDAGDRLVGQQIPGRQVLIAPTHDQPERLASQSRIRMSDAESQDLQLDGALVNGIPSGSLGPSTQVSGEVPWTLLVALEISQVIIGYPAPSLSRPAADARTVPPLAPTPLPVLPSSACLKGTWYIDSTCKTSLVIQREVTPSLCTTKEALFR